MLWLNKSLEIFRQKMVQCLCYVLLLIFMFAILQQSLLLMFHKDKILPAKSIAFQCWIGKFLICAYYYYFFYLVGIISRRVASQ